MAKFNSANAAPARKSAVAHKTGITTNHDGRQAYQYDDKSALFLWAVSDFVSEGSFYEAGSARDERAINLARTVAVGDLDWTAKFVNWLRNEANMRSASLLVALEGAYALNKAGIPGGRALVNAAMARADEPGEALAYWHTRHGRKVPKGVKRGIADAASRLYNQRSLSKYDSKGRAYRFGDVVELTHPLPSNSSQSDLFKYAVARRHDDKAAVPASLARVGNRKEFFSLSGDDLRKLVERPDASKALADANVTWEALSGAISGGMDKAAWEAIIPNMGYMALLRNLRNFQQAGVSASVMKSVYDRLGNEDEVAKSRQLPMRFLSAYRAVKGNLKAEAAVQDALDASLRNVPVLKGKTLILVDCSGSMTWSNSAKSDLNFMDSAAVFGTALALAAENADLVAFGTASRKVSFNKDDSVLPIVNRFRSMGGTDTARAVRDNLKDHNRVIILTDEQYNGYYGRNPMAEIPSNVTAYTWNLNGYDQSHGDDSKNKFYFGGLSDQSFKTISLLEAGRDGSWPWED